MAELCLKAGWIYKAVLFTLEASQCMLDVGEMNPRWVMWGVIKFRGDKSCWGCSAQNAGSLNNNKQIYHVQKDTVGPYLHVSYATKIKNTFYWTRRELCTTC
jgi:hypothetical protein